VDFEGRPRAAVRRSAAADQDLGIIFDHLVEAYVALGEAEIDAFERAAARLRGIEYDIERLGLAPMQGTLCTELAPCLRRVTKNGAVFYFEVSADGKRVDVLAVFFGGQDHQRRMLARLLR
jgi:plasmid stabilization system protein ParE